MFRGIELINTINIHNRMLSLKRINNKNVWKMRSKRHLEAKYEVIKTEMFTTILSYFKEKLGGSQERNSIVKNRSLETVGD
jgi:hypothetical protein